MKKIVLLISGGGDVQQALEFALKTARQEKDAEIIPTYVIDDEVPASVSSWLIYVGFLGDKPSDEYKQAILKEYHHRAEDDLKEIAARISADGISCRTHLLEGPLLQTVKKTLAEEEADLLVIAVPGKSEVGSALYRDAARSLKKEALCEVKIV